MNRSEVMLVGRKRDEDKTPVMSAILNRLDLVPKTHHGSSSGDCSAS